MRFKVEGADRVSGTDRGLIVTAEDEADAEAQAQRLGMVVSQVRNVGARAGTEDNDPPPTPTPVQPPIPRQPVRHEHRKWARNGVAMMVVGALLILLIPFRQAIHVNEQNRRESVAAVMGESYRLSDGKRIEHALGNWGLFVGGIILVTGGLVAQTIVGTRRIE